MLPFIIDLASAPPLAAADFVRLAEVRCLRLKRLIAGVADENDLALDPIYAHDGSFLKATPYRAAMRAFSSSPTAAMRSAGVPMSYWSAVPTCGLPQPPLE